MAVDYCVALDCEPKRHFGKGDCLTGTAEILDRLKARNRGEMIRQMAASDGQDPSEISVMLHVPDRDGRPVQKEVSLAELEEEARGLDEQASACRDCPANFRGEAYGCLGVVNYPVPAATEDWLLRRVQPPGTVGAELCLGFMDDFKVDGRSIRQMRREGFFEDTKSGRVTFKKGLLRNLSVSADQLLETMLMAGEALDPGHCFGVLLWLGAITVDGQTPGGPEDQATIETLMALETLEEKERHTDLNVGPPELDEAGVLQTFVTAMYLAWLHDVPLLVSA